MKNKIKKILKEHPNLPNDIEVKSMKTRKQSILSRFSAGGNEFFLKIRKRSHQKPEKFEEIIKDEKLVEGARKEEEALKFFNKVSDDEKCPVNFITPVTCIEEINGIVTEKVDGEDLWKLVRKNQAHNLFKNIGEGLKQIHQKIKTEKKELEFDFKETGNPKIDRKINKLKQKIYNKKSATIEGLPIADIRDIFISNKNEIYFLDTPPLNEDFVYRSLAYLIGTLRIINQGYLNFIFKRVDKKYENNFLEGYFNNDEYDKDLLNLFILERLTVFYNNVLNTLSNKKRFKIPFVKKLVKKYYIDKFYYREMNEIIKEIEEEK